MNEPCPTEIKAQAVAMMCLGYSARRAERALRAKYPGVDVPRYSTISRWLASAEVVHMAKRSNYWQWQLVAKRVCEIVYERMGELTYASPMQMLRGYESVMRVYESSMERRRTAIRQ